MTTLNYTITPERAAPFLAPGVAVTPNATPWANSAWVEIDPAIAANWVLGHLTYDVGDSGDTGLFEIAIGTGAAGLETEIGVLCGHAGMFQFDGLGILDFPCPLGPIAAGSRVSIRIRRAGTDTTAWGISLGYYVAALAGNASVSAIAPKAYPPAAAGVAVTPNASAWTASAWVELIASTAAGAVLAAIVLERGVIQNDAELDIGTGAPGSEVVKTTIALAPPGEFFVNGPSVTPLRPMLALATGVRVAIRLRKAGTHVANWTFKATGYEAFDRAELTTSRPQVCYPPAAASVVITAGAGSWVPGAWVQLDPAVATAIAITGLAYPEADGYEADVDLGIGAAGLETVITTFRINLGDPENGIAPLHYARNVAAGQRLSARLWSTHAAATLPIKVTAVTAPDFTQVTDEPQDVWPDRAPGASANMNPTSWGNSAWSELVADSGIRDVVITGMCFQALYGDHAEIDIGFGASGSEVVATTYRMFGEANATSHHPYRLLPIPLAVAAGTRVSFRVRRYNNAVAGGWRIALTRTPAVVTVPPPAATITKENSWCGDLMIAWVEFFHRDDLGNPKTFFWSEVPVAGPYEYLDARAIRLGVCERKASEMGRLEGSHFTFQLADTDNAIRAFLANAFQIALFDVEVVVKLETLEDFMAGIAPLIVFRGLLKSYDAAGRTMSLTVQDWLSSRIGEDVPLARIGTDFPGAPVANRERGGPIVYGAYSDEGSSGAGPVNTPETASFVEAPNLCGFGLLGGTVPTTPAAANAGAIGSLVAGEYFVMVTTVKNGKESDPAPFYGIRSVVGPVSITVGDGDAITASCDDMGASADSYRFYLGFFGADFFWPCMVESLTPSVTFTSIDPTVQAGGQATIPGIYGYAASFLYSDGETPLTTDVNVIYIGLTRGYRRPVRMTFEPAGVGVLGMRIYRKYASGGYDRVWTIPLTQLNGDGNIYFEDDLLDTGATFITGPPSAIGKLTPIYVGEFEAIGGGAWSGFVTTQHACADPAVVNVYIDGVAIDPGNYGVTVLAPGQPGFLTYFGPLTYRVTLTGNRWTLIYLRGPDAADIIAGTKTLRVNVNGIEAVGDGTGLLIRSTNYQARHFARNFVMCDAPWSGDVDWFGMPSWADGQDKIDDASFDTAEADASILLGDTEGARAITTIRPMLDILAEMAIDSDAAYGFTRVGKFKWFFEDPDPFAVSVATIDEFLDVADDTFKFTDQTDPTWFHNVIEYQWDPQLDASGGVSLKQTAKYTDDVSQFRYGKNGARRIIKATAPLQLFGRRNPATALALVTRHMARHAAPTRHVDQVTGMYWFLREIGEILGVTNSEGATATGWTAELTRIRQLAADFAPWTVKIRSRQLPTALQVSLSNALVEEFMSDVDLGGIREGSPDLTAVASQTVLPAEYRDRLVQWPIVPASAAVKARVFCKVDDAALTLTPEVYNVTDGLVVVTGTPVTAGAFASQDMTIPRPVTNGNTEYRLRATVAGGDVAADPTRTIGLFGAIRVIFP